MFKTTIAAMLFATTATAGDYLEGYYFYVVGSIKSEITMDTGSSAGRPEFRETLYQLTAEWRAKCGEGAFVWHTNLMGNHNDAAEWVPDYWFAYIGMEESEAKLRAAIPESPCAAQGYIKQGSMLIPGIFYYCLEPDLEHPEAYEQTCN